MSKKTVGALAISCLLFGFIFRQSLVGSILALGFIIFGIWWLLKLKVKKVEA